MSSALIALDATALGPDCDWPVRTAADDPIDLVRLRNETRTESGWARGRSLKSSESRLPRRLAGTLLRGK